MFSSRLVDHQSWSGSLTYIAALAQLVRSIEDGLGVPVANDTIQDVGQQCLHIIRDRPDEVIRLAQKKLHTWPYAEVPNCWRRLYEEASLWKAIQLIQHQLDSHIHGQSARKRKRNGTVADARHDHTEPEDWVADAARPLDMAIILTGSPGRKDLIMKVFDSLQRYLVTIDDIDQHFLKTARPPSMIQFQTHLDLKGTPLFMEHVISTWPALLGSDRNWRNPQYLLKSTLGGRRLVPIELGRSYTDEGWGQKIMTFAEYMRNHLLQPDPEQTGYLAQHDLFAQIPSLMADTMAPDYCYTEPPRNRERNKTQPILDEPLRNAWFGPMSTISPLHTDPYHNIFCQVVGSKYIRLYAPSETPKLYPRSIDEAGVNMENTSNVDIELAMKIFDGDLYYPLKPPKIEDAEKKRAEFDARFPLFRKAKFVEGILHSGDCLYIPAGWWHYMESLQTSFSVSFWWN
ncbi:hypothetical protein H2203_000233 [Taxawa tesnikishii (nom. ined.)]|nr:hypothetical protein H2203_000233 [Dothideales sp. JES 119]